jgi:glycosyltransferase involved in cell wall biosynthesis
VEKKRVIVAGQVPPPQGGQNVLIAHILDELHGDESLQTIHWPFFFSRTFGALRRPSMGKLVELIRCLWRLLRIRIAGPIHLLLYPSGGPHLVPVIRDLCLLPFARAFSETLIIQFHAAGIAEKIERPHPFYQCLKSLMRRADGAIVMTNYNRIDPLSVGIKEIEIIPARLTDEAPEGNRVIQGREKSRILYVGHLCPDKGTPSLLEAFGNILRDFTDLELELVGEPLIPYDWDRLRNEAERFEVQSSLVLSGVLTGSEKKDAFTRANLFIFPTIAPYESFGLVLVEAMMFGLPIVATDWRGNRDVLGDDPGGLLFPTDQPLASRIEQAIRDALLRKNEWGSWGERNRKRYESNFQFRSDRRDYAAFVRRTLSSKHAPKNDSSPRSA